LPTNTVAAWRRKPDHPLKWELVTGKFVRYRAGDLKRYMALPAKRRGAPTPNRRSDHPELPADHDPATP
jgi:hypothetical protein